VDTRSGLPPGPRFAALNSFRYARDAYGFLAKIRGRYGDPIRVDTVNGVVYLTGTPAGAQQVFTADPDTFVPFAAEVVRPLIGDNSILLLFGARHRRERKLLVPAFHGERMRAYGETIRAAALAAAAAWPSDREFVFQTSSQWISLEVIIRAVFGVVEPGHVEAVRAAILELVASAAPSMLFFPFMQRSFFGLGPWPRLQRARERIDLLIAGEIAARRARADEAGEDILSLMLRARDEEGAPMSDAELRDELLTLLFAGHETTGIALAWAIYWLHRDPERLGRLREELDAAGERPDPEVIARMPYLEAVVQETLRLHPIVPDIPRQLARPFELGGYKLPPGAAVSVATALLHSAPETFPEPDKFKPERFLGRKYTPFEYTPFGGGARRCLGAAFATYEMKIVLATLLGRFRLELAESEVRPGRRNLVLGPASGVRVRYLGPRAAAGR